MRTTHDLPGQDGSTVPIGEATEKQRGPVVVVGEDVEPVVSDNSVDVDVPHETDVDRVTIIIPIPWRPLHPTKVERASGAAANVTGVPSSYIAVQSLLTVPAVIEQLMPAGSLDNVPLPPPSPCTANSCCGTVTPPHPTVIQVINVRAWGRVTGRLAKVVMEG